MQITELEEGQLVRVRSVFEGRVVVRNGMRLLRSKDRMSYFDFEPDLLADMEVFGERNDWPVKIRTLLFWIYRGGHWDWLTCKREVQQRLWDDEET